MMFENSKGHAATRSLMQLLLEVISSHRGEIAPQRFKRALGASFTVNANTLIEVPVI